jgi:outer membrane immunogenic protein
MRRILPAIAALAGLMAVPAVAADLAVRPAPPLPAFFSWTGCFFGAHAGGVVAKKDWTERTPEDAFFGVSEGGHDAAGFLGGVQAGCDLQAGGFVIGVQGDFALTDAQGDYNHPFIPERLNHSRVESLASVTARIGFAWDRFLGYVKGGGAWERDDYWATTTILGTAYTSREGRSGWSIGVGGEYAFTSALSGFVEYSYFDFGTHQISLTPQVAGLRPAFADVTETKSVVRAGLNLRFGGYVPAGRM